MYTEIDFTVLLVSLELNDMPSLYKYYLMNQNRFLSCSSSSVKDYLGKWIRIKNLYFHQNNFNAPSNNIIVIQNKNH